MTSETSIERKESQCSYEFGKPTARHKIYYWEVEELTGKIQKLKEAGLVEALI